MSGPASKLRLKAGDIFLLITDGFVEFENPKQEEFGRKRLEEAIRTARTQSPDQIIKSLYQAVLKFSSGTKQMDDLTAVVIKRV